MDIQNNKMIVTALAVIAVLLAAIAGFIIYQQSTALPGVTVAPSTGATGTGTTGTGTTGSGMMGGATGGTTGGAAASAPFDPKTATKVPKGMTPEQLLRPTAMPS